MTDTPRTDVLLKRFGYSTNDPDCNCAVCTFRNLSRTLERELAEARDQIEQEAVRSEGDCASLAAMRNDLRASTEYAGSLVGLVRRAVQECDSHNRDYHHLTKRDFFEDCAAALAQAPEGAKINDGLPTSAPATSGVVGLSGSEVPSPYRCKQCGAGIDLKLPRIESTVPGEGLAWKLVPTEATPAMIDALRPGKGSMPFDEAVRSMWRDLLAAAPEREVSGEGLTFPRADTDTHVYFYERDFYPLGNFSAFSICWRGLDFATSEHAYHWEKFPDAAGVRDWILCAPSAHEAFKLAEQFRHMRRADWGDVKTGIMRDILREKVKQHEYVRRKLLATGDRVIVEDSWRDAEWGCGPNGDGENLLGKLWMEIRAELRASSGERTNGESDAPPVVGTR